MLAIFRVEREGRPEALHSIDCLLEMVRTGADSNFSLASAKVLFGYSFNHPLQNLMCDRLSREVMMQTPHDQSDFLTRLSTIEPPPAAQQTKINIVP